jgi:hypothetical protein
MNNKILISFFCAVLVFCASLFADESSLSSSAKTYSKEPKDFDDKNEVLSLVARAALDFYLKGHGYGELKEFSINNKTKKFFFKTKLKGEEKFLSVSVNRYDVVKEGGKYFFVAKEIVTDREWLNTAAKNFLEEKKIEIPAQYTIFILAAL